MCVCVVTVCVSRYLGSGSYDITSQEKSQSFPLQPKSADTSSLGIKFITLKVLSNHGHPNYTCIYDFKVFELTSNANLTE